jgi:signal peptidase II
VKFIRTRGKYICLTLGIFLLNYLLDRITKYLALEYLSGKDPIVLLDNLVILVFTQNTGAFLSLGANWNIYIKYFALLIIPIAICIYGIFYLMLKEKKIYRIVILSCVIGGGIGNLSDRLFNGFNVIDFLNFGIGNIRTGILNVADLSVTFGMVVLLIFEMRNDRRAKIPG